MSSVAIIDASVLLIKSLQRLTDNHLLDHYKLSSPISISRTKTNPSAIPPGIYDLEGDTGAIMDLQSLRQTPTSKRPRDEKVRQTPAVVSICRGINRFIGRSAPYPLQGPKENPESSKYFQ